MANQDDVFAFNAIDFTAEDASKRFADSLHKTGFAVIKNHSISPEKIEALYAGWQAYFAQSNDAKMRSFYKDHEDKEEGTQAGYMPKGEETAAGETVADIKEFYHFYLENRERMPELPDGLEEQTEAFFLGLKDIGRELLSWLEKETPEEAFSIPREERDKLDTMPDGGNLTLLRMIRYPALSGDEPKDAVRAAAHTDINLITLLVTGKGKGLEVLEHREDGTKKWHPVPCESGYITVNAGDMLKLLTTNDVGETYYPSTVHKVVNPEKGSPEASQDRYSAAFFVHPSRDVMLAPGITAKKALHDRLVEIGLKEADTPDKVVGSITPQNALDPEKGGRQAG